MALKGGEQQFDTGGWDPSRSGQPGEVSETLSPFCERSRHQQCTNIKVQQS